MKGLSLFLCIFFIAPVVYARAPDLNVYSLGYEINDAESKDISEFGIIVLNESDVLQLVELWYNSSGWGTVDDAVQGEAYIRKNYSGKEDEGYDYLDGRFTLSDNDVTPGINRIGNFMGNWTVSKGYNRISMILVHYYSGGQEIDDRFYISLQVGTPDFGIINRSTKVQPGNLSIGNATNITLTVANYGDGPFEAYVECDITKWNTTYIPWVGTFKFNISKGENITIQVRDENETNNFTEYWIPEENGIYIMGCIIDPPYNSTEYGHHPNGDFIESNEDNNAEYIAIQVGTPDFEFVKDSIIIKPYAVFVNDALNITAAVINHGDGPFVSYAEMDINPWGENGENPSWIGTFNINLSENENYTGAFLNNNTKDKWPEGAWIPDREGIYIAAALIDPPFNSTEEGYHPYGYILESNETNNVNYAPVYVFRKINSSTPIEWLEAQLTADQENGTGRLIKSYGTDSRKFNAYTYDQALAIMAFTLDGRYESARQILDELKYLQYDDGSFPFCWISYKPKSANCSLKKMAGANAWIVMAVNYYTLAMNDFSYIDMAEKNAAWILSYQDINGGIKGGFNFDDNNTPIGNVSWKSTEHNLDAYSALKYLYIITGNETYKNASNRVKEWLETKAWNSSEGRFWQGENDSYPVTDTNTWAILALGRGNETYDYTRGVGWIYNYTRYLDANASVEGFDFNYDLDFDTDGIIDGVDTVWVEGTEGAVLAFYEIGDELNASHFHNEIKKLKQDDGSFPYVTRTGSLPQLGLAYNWTSVSGTAWHLFGEHRFNPFKPPMLENLTFNISLKKGWNLISIPLKLENETLPAPLKSIEGSYSRAFSYDNINKRMYELKNGSRINETIGFWINMAQDDVLKIGGAKSAERIALSKGWNLIGHPSLDISNLSAANTLNDINYSIIYAYNNSKWHSAFKERNESLNTLRYLIPGYGYWIKSI